MYPKSIYKDGSEHVAWSPEEHAARKADGWSDHKPATAAAAADPESTSTDDTASTISTPEPEAPARRVVKRRRAPRLAYRLPAIETTNSAKKA